MGPSLRTSRKVTRILDVFQEGGPKVLGGIGPTTSGGVRVEWNSPEIRETWRRRDGSKGKEYEKDESEWCPGNVYDKRDRSYEKEKKRSIGKNSSRRSSLGKNWRK